MTRATEAVSDFLHHAAARDLPDAELFELKAAAFDLMAERAAEENDVAECRRIADGARAVAARLAPPDGVCDACWLFAHSRCDRRASCTCRTCYPHRRPPPEGDGEHA